MGGFLLVPGLMLALIAFLLTGCDHEDTIAPPKAPQQDAGRHDDRAQAALDQFVAAVRQHDRAQAVAVATPASRALLGWAADNAAALRIDDLSMRYVDDGAQLGAEDRSRLGASAWRGTLQLEYRYQGVDSRSALLETSAVFVPTSGGARIASFGSAGERSPLWLVDRLSVVRTPESVLVVAGGAPGRYARLVARALVQVRHVLPAWHGPLVVEVPRTRAQLDAVLQAQPGEYDDIAAVTTTADGSLTPGAAVRVFVNPPVFGRLEERGAQVVMSHESTHVATGATFASMPTWLLEGFADYVALDEAEVPVRVAAGQILPRIRRDGLPTRLPSAQDLAPTAVGLGATYEEAWLACRFLGQKYGTQQLVRFYEQVSDGTAAGVAFRSVLGTTQRSFVARWRADLARLAGVTR